MATKFHDAAVEFDGTVQIGTKPTYTITNDTTDRNFDADTAADAEIADVLATLLKDLEAMGLITVA